MPPRTRTIARSTRCVGLRSQDGDGRFGAAELNVQRSIFEQQMLRIPPVR
jgi:hypothetical protein